MKNSLKAGICRLFFDRMLSPHMPLSEAIVMTFGGRGFEPQVWKEMGIQTNHGWLVERNRKLSKRLIQVHRYRIHNELQTLPQILAGHGPGKDHVDATHIDLCGTFSEDAVCDFSPMLPLIFKSRGRCLAITTADARRNLVLENWSTFLERGRKLFGIHTEAIYEKILALQEAIPTGFSDLPDFIRKTSFTPEKGAKREFGILVELAELLQCHKFRFLPSHIERYVYVSDYAGRARMRTYFFRFDKRTVIRPELALARLWTKSRLQYSRNGEFKDVTILSVKQQTENKEDIKMPKTKQVSDSTSKLARIAIAVGGEVEAEYNALVGRAAKADQVVAALKQIAPLGDILRSISGMSTTPAAIEPQATAPRARRGRPPGVSDRKTFDSLSPKELIDMRVEALELRAASNGEWPTKKKEFLLSRFGYHNKNLSRRLGGFIAQGTGVLREQFLKGIVADLGEEEAKPYIDRVEKLPASVSVR